MNRAPGLPAFALLAIAGVALTAAPAEADACSCIGMKPEAYFDGAEMVFLARAGEEKEVAGKPARELTVLQALKGKPGATYTLATGPDSVSPCTRFFTDGEVAFVFLSGGATDLCQGNFGLSVQIAWAPALLKKSGLKRAKASFADVKAALEVALKGYTHARKIIPVYYPPLKGKSFRLESSEIRFTDARGKDSVHTLVITGAGALRHIAGEYELEGLVFEVLVHSTGKGGVTVVGSSVAER